MIIIIIIYLLKDDTIKRARISHYYRTAPLTPTVSDLADMTALTIKADSRNFITKQLFNVLVNIVTIIIVILFFYPFIHAFCQLIINIMMMMMMMIAHCGDRHCCRVFDIFDAFRTLKR